MPPTGTSLEQNRLEQKRLEQKRTVRRDDSITFLGGGVRPSLSTPSMIMYMEMCSREAILPHLEEGQDSVGTKVCIEHLAAAPMGSEITYRAAVKEIDRRRVAFDVEALQGEKIIGRGTHERFVIDVARFAAKLKQSLG